jgi:hypothetical protein
MFDTLLSLFALLAEPDVSVLVSRLGHDSFAVREDASRELCRVRPQCLLPYYYRTKDPEVRYRLRGLLGDLAPSTGVACYPCVDSLWKYKHPVTGGWSYCYGNDGPPEVRELYRLCLPYLGKAGGTDGPPYRNFRLATALLVKDLRDCGVPEAYVAGMLRTMGRRDPDGPPPWVPPPGWALGLMGLVPVRLLPGPPR